MKIVLLISLLVVVVAVVIRRWYVDVGLKRARGYVVHVERDEVLGKILSKVGREDWKQGVSDFLSGGDSLGGGAVEHARMVIGVGMMKLREGDEAVWRRRQWAQKFGMVFPIFVFVVMVFAVVVAKVAMTWGLIAVVGSVAVAVLAQFFVVIADRAAGELGIVAVDRVYYRVQDEEMVVTAVRRLAWAGVLPSVLRWFL